ncbi:hypothetical protein [Microbacterium sp. P5_E9]
MTAGLFSIDTATRTARGVLLPWNVKSKGTSASQTKPITFPRGNVAIPRDPIVIGLNDEHERFHVIGRAVALTDAEEGIVAEFRIAETEEGDEWLAEHASTAFFSAEIDDLRRLPGDVGVGRLAGAAVTKQPAFDGTAVGLFSLIGTETEEGTEPIETTEPASADEDEEPDEEPDETEEDAVAEAIAPASMQASRRKAEAPALTKAGFFSALNKARSTGDRSDLMPYAQAAAEVGLFALSNVKYDGVGGLVTDALMPGTWLGELWQGRRFQRKIIPLLTSGTLTSLSATGWVWGIKPAMAAWAGNKTPIPSNAPTVEPRQFAGVRFAGGHDLAVEYYHFGQTDVINSYADAMIDSYAELSDSYALTQVTAGATVYTPDPANTVNTGLLDIVDGALAVVAGGGTPSWSLVAPDIFKGVLATPREDALDYFSASLGLEGGSTSGATSFAIVPDARLAPGAIIVGDKGGATAWELPGVPIRVEAPDLVLGGVDNAFFGYIAVGVTNPNVIVKNAAAGVLEDVVEGVEESAKASKK